MSSYDRLLSNLLGAGCTCPGCAMPLHEDDLADAEDYPAAVEAFPGICSCCVSEVRICEGCCTATLDANEWGLCPQCEAGAAEAARFQRSNAAVLAAEHRGL